MFIGNRNLTYDPWIWLKVKSKASTASNKTEVVEDRDPRFISQISIANEHTDIFFIR